MSQWLCYEDSSTFYVEAETREEAQIFASLYDGHVVCLVNETAQEDTRSASVSLLRSIGR
jgi:hypothetical protein